MELGRCRRLITLSGLALAGVLALGGSPLTAAGARAWVPAPCGTGGAPPGAETAWYRLDPALDGTGTLHGMRLVAGSRTGTRVLALAPEAFASGPAAGRVVAGEDDGRRSLLRAVDPVRGCATVIAKERDAVVRSAIATPDGRALYEHRVDRRTRADLGVWRRELVGWRSRGQVRRVLEPMRPDARYGPTFTTSIHLGAGGSVVVASCGERACRTRLLSDGEVREIGPTGPALGVSDGIVVTRGACAGLPCPVVAHDPDGTSRVLVEAAWQAALGGDHGDTLVAQEADGRLRVVAVGSGATIAMPSMAGSPVGGGSLATSGASLRPGEFALGADGRAGPAGSVSRMVPAAGEVLP